MMHKRPWLLLAAIAMLASGCGLLLDLDPPVTTTEPRSFLCEAQIYRTIGSEFTEERRAWVFAPGEAEMRSLGGSGRTWLPGVA